MSVQEVDTQTNAVKLDCRICKSCNFKQSCLNNKSEKLPNDQCFNTIESLTPTRAIERNIEDRNIASALTDKITNELADGSVSYCY